MAETIRTIPQWEREARVRIDERLERTLQSGFALPEDVANLNALASLTKLAINFRYSAALVFGRQFVELSDKIIDTPNNIEGKIQGLKI